MYTYNRACGTNFRFTVRPAIVGGKKAKAIERCAVALNGEVFGMASLIKFSMAVRVDGVA